MSFDQRQVGWTPRVSDLWRRGRARDNDRRSFHRKIPLVAIIEAAGWPIWLIILASVTALAIIIERFWSLRTSAIAPSGLLDDTIGRFRAQGVTQDLLDTLYRGPLIGRIFCAALANASSPREVMKDAVEDAGRAVALELERFLGLLGTIATVATLLGLFGTIVGMIEIFGSQTASGSNPSQLAHGISVALYNTLFGIGVAIPAVIFHRHFRERVDTLVVQMEGQAIRLVEIVRGERRA